MRAPFVHTILREHERISGRGRAVDDVLAEQILRFPVVTNPDGVDDPSLLQHFAWTPKGLEAYRATRQMTYTLFGGAKGGGKTVTGARIIAADCVEYTGALFVVMRRNYTTLHTTTKASFERFFPKDLIVRKTTHRWELVNGNAILWWAADRSRDPNYEKTRGLEATGIFPDEASEFDQEFYEILPTLLRREARHIITGEAHPYWLYLTSNPVPGSNYLKRNFIDPRTRAEDHHVFIPSLPDENPLLPDGYIDRAFSRMSDEMRAMLRFGDWDVDASEFVIVPLESLADVLIDRVDDTRAVAAGVDIGLGRPDRTVVVCANASGQMWVEATFEEYDTTIQTERIAEIIGPIIAGKGRAWIDEGSVGKGVVDALRRQFSSRSVVGVMFGAAAEEERQPDGTKQRVHDLKRDQLYFWLREDVMQGDIALERNDELVEELENTYYLPTDRYLKIEPKDEIKRRIARSPDTADAVALCNAARRRRRVSVALPGRRTKTSSTSITDRY